MPLPCAHPNCHSLAYLYRSPQGPVPLTRLIDARQNSDLLANGILFTRPKARQLIEQYLARIGAGCCGGNVAAMAAIRHARLTSADASRINSACRCVDTD